MQKDKRLKVVNFLFSKFYLIITDLIRFYEKKYIKEYSSKVLKHQPVFIIGAPRTGSTVLYQTITNQLDVLYIDNITCRFYKNLFFGFLLSKKLYNQKAHNCFKSNHGDTTKCGNHAPSECGEFWYRWLSTDEHFVDYDVVTEQMISEIRDEITAITNYFDKPIVFKNLNAGQRLRLLSKCFPNAKFIFIKREPLFTAQSILKAKRKIGISDNTFWSIKPKNFKELENVDPYQQIVKQIYFLEKQIMKDSVLFHKNNFLCLNYKDLGNDFTKTINVIQNFISVSKRQNFEKAEVHLKEILSLEKNEINILQENIKKFDWIKYD